MASRPAFGALKKPKPAPAESVATPKAKPAPTKAPERIQTSIRLHPAMWAALNDLATRKRMETGQRVTVHDMLIEGARHILAVNGVKLAK
jgi:hypothetical protein